jgi:dipeptidyl aminopeptidase/acylaminoacyl peptidase
VTAEDPTPGELARRLQQWLEYPSSGGASVTADGRWVYHTSNRGGIPQAWRIGMEGGEPTRIHSGPERVGSIAAAPEGVVAVLSIDQGGDEQWQLSLYDPAAPELRPLTHDPKVIHSPGGWRDASRFVFSANRRDPRFFDVYELDVHHPTTASLLYQEDALLGVHAAHGERVLLSRARTNLDSDLLLLEGTSTRLLTPHSGELTIASADLATDSVIAAANPEREFTGLVRYREGSSEVLREFAGDVELVRADRERRRVALAVNRDGWSEVHLVDLATNESRPVELGSSGVVSGIEWTPEGRALLLDLSSPTEGNEVVKYDLDGGKIHLVTRSPVSMPGRIAPPHLSKFTASDGLEVPYWDYAAPAPAPRGTLFWIHGGPEGQARPGFQPILSFLVESGWRVITPNVRGSTGYGRTFVHLDDVRKRMDSVRDVRDLVHFLAGRGELAPGNVGILGGSYGGFMVLSAIATYPELWGAAADFVGIANFVTFLERTKSWRRKVREDEYGSLEHDREFLESISPIHHTDRMRTPLLVVHGANDPRVPVSEAEQIVEALRKQHVPVEFLRYENEGHGLVRRENQVEAYARVAYFMSRHLAPLAVPGAPV